MTTKNSGSLAGPSGRPAVILVVDDSKTIRDLLGMYLGFEGYLVRFATNGREALSDILRNGKPDVIITDIEMPEMNGRELIRSCQADDALAKIALIVVSESITETSARLEGVSAAFGKPVDFDELNRAIVEVLKQVRK